MRKVRFLTSIVIMIMMASCTDKDEPVLPGDDDIETPDDNPAEQETIDLSAEEMANCYIVTSPGKYRFKADNQFNLGEGLPVPPQINPVSASLVWQTIPGSITSVALEKTEATPYVEFEVHEASGNALIAVVDADSNILWSWHIWMPAEEVVSVPTDTGYEVMNMNLGAMNNRPGDAASYGLLYQWGRKDPFPAAATLTGDATTVGADLFDIDNKRVKITNSNWFSSECNTLEYAITNPTVCLSNYSYFTTSRDWLVVSEDNLWGNPTGDYRDPENNTFPNKGQKSCYDPSPAGWRVAPPDVFRNFTTSGGYAWSLDDFAVADVNGDGTVDLDDYRYGWHFLLSPQEPMFFPAAARYDGSYAMLMGSMSGLWGNYWSNAPYSSINGGAYCCLSFSIKDQNGNDMITVSPSAGSSRADAFSIRCIRDN